MYRTPITIGRHYDKDGNFTSNWWPDEVISAFKSQAICIADQYAKFEIPMVNKNVDGNETLADNVCDNSALRVSWLAYQMWAKDHNIIEPSLPGLDYTIPQIFYISYGQVSHLTLVTISIFSNNNIFLSQIWCEVNSKEGYEQYVRDTHSPGQFRTLGVVQNNKYFGDIFHCPKNSPMNPPKEQKCVLWS